MKKLIASTLFILVFVCLFSFNVFADIMPPNSHPIDRCVKIVNLNEFPDIVLIGYYTGPMVEKYESYQIKDNECLTKGYKFNTLSIYWSTKEKSSSIVPNNVLLENVESNGEAVDQSNPLIKEDIEYSLARSSDGKLVLYKSKQISEYNDGTSTKVKTFSNPFADKEPNTITPSPSTQPVVTPTPSLQPIVTPTPEQPTVTPSPSPEPIQRGFWESIVCFFWGLFGKAC